MSRAWMRHVRSVNESCLFTHLEYTSKCYSVMNSTMWQVNEPCLAYDWVMYLYTPSIYVTYSYVWRGWFVIISWVVQICHVTPTYHAQITVWRRPIGCLKLQVVFRKRATNYRALMRKVTYKDKAFYHSTPSLARETLYVLINQVYSMTHAYLWSDDPHI